MLGHNTDHCTPLFRFFGKDAENHHELWKGQKYNRPTTLSPWISPLCLW